jgi:hypothetical protein
MKFLEISSAMQVSGRNGYEIYVIRRDFREFVSVVLGPGTTKSLWKLAGGFFIRLRLSPGRQDLTEHEREKSRQKMLRGLRLLNSVDCSS